MIPRYCSFPGCSTIVGSGRCATHRPAESATRTNVETRRWYCTARWRRLRATVQRRQPACALCHAEGRTVLGTEVDHIEPHQGDVARFWDVANLQNLCKTHHAQKTRKGR